MLCNFVFAVLLLFYCQLPDFSNALIYYEGAEKVVGWALSHHLMQNSKAEPDANLVLSGDR